jgi:tetratricopeptide (TPR) repeat protein
MKKVLSALVALAVSMLAAAQNGPVKMWEGTIDLPTYRVNTPEKAPLFERDFAYQRAKRGVYPYAMNDNPTLEKVDSTHRALYLENDYIKVCVLPDIGGRLFYATDKTNGYEIFYRQSVIKPQNVGMLGAWISGGVEWNVFHHHRATSQYPIDYTLVDNGDGSKTIWVGEVEERHRMSWAIGLTLYPDKSYIEVTGRFFNDSENRNSMLHWNNVATHANENYQIIFPETTKFGMFHHKSSHIHWPVANEPYKGNPDFVGVDVSWWKNLPSLTGDSVFIQDLQDDFVGGYDHGKDAGTMLAGNHNINKGGKFWTWGHLTYGHMWDCVTLTDEDGPYVELMTSAYSDNQPDYCWINPQETKEFTAYWYGIRNLRHVNRGNQKATVNMDIDPAGQVHVAANVTQIRRKARITVSSGDALLYEKTADIAPDKPFADDFTAEPALLEDPTAVTMRLFSADGELLIDYHPYKHDINEPLPADLQPVNPDPRSIANAEECYYVGMRNLQFHQAHVDPNDYFLEVLRRDPGDVRANTQMGIFHRFNGEYGLAKQFLRKAIARQTANYTRPADGEAMYNLGLILKEEGRWHDAIDTLYRAVWDYEYASAAYYQLSRISSINGDGVRAMQEASMAVNYNGMNVDARNMKVTLLRREGKKADALAQAREIIAFDPLNHYAARELMLLGGLSRAAFEKLLRRSSESYIELACRYFGNGFAEEGEAVLREAEAIKPYPTVEYYLGYLADVHGDKAAAAEWFTRADAGSIDFVFPFRMETLRVYGKALEYMPESAKTWYYLGNLLYQKQPDKARECWEKAVKSNPSFAMALRNIGWYWRFKDEYHDKDMEDYATALEYYLKAIDADKDNRAIFLTEADEVMERMNAPLKDRYDMFMSHGDITALRYDSEVRKIQQMILHGDYDEALELLLSKPYSRREHIDDLHDIYVNACLLAGFHAKKEGNVQAALRYMLMAAEYPENQFYGHLEYSARDAQVYYNIGLAYEEAGDSENARKYYEMAADVKIKPKDCIYNYEKGLAMRKLDPKAKVRNMNKDIVDFGKAYVTEKVQNFFESFDRGPYENDVNSAAYYAQGVGHLALGHRIRAKRAFRKALAQRNDNVWANYYLGNLK